MGTRLSLYYIFVVFFIFFVIGPAVTLLLLDAEEKKQLLSGQLDLKVGFLLAVNALLAPLVIAVTVGFVYFVDRKPLHAIGAVWPPGAGRRVPRDLAASFAGAAAILGLWYVVAGLMVRFEPGDAVTAGDTTASGLEILLLGLGFLVSASADEWILRGYVYSSLREKLSWVHAGGISAFLFAMFQLVRPGVPAPGLASAFLIGMLLAAVRELSGSLWTCVVFLGSWNFLMGCVLALPVSGSSVPAFHSVKVEGSALWSGGEFGPEGSWLMVGLVLLVVVAAAAVLGQGEDAEASPDGTAD